MYQDELSLYQQQWQQWYADDSQRHISNFTQRQQAWQQFQQLAWPQAHMEQWKYFPCRLMADIVWSIKPSAQDCWSDLSAPWAYASHDIAKAAYTNVADLSDAGLQDAGPHSELALYCWQLAWSMERYQLQLNRHQVSPFIYIGHQLNADVLQQAYQLVTQTVSNTHKPHGVWQPCYYHLRLQPHSKLILMHDWQSGQLLMLRQNERATNITHEVTKGGWTLETLPWYTQQWEWVIELEEGAQCIYLQHWSHAEKNYLLSRTSVKQHAHSTFISIRLNSGGGYARDRLEIEQLAPWAKAFVYVWSLANGQGVCQNQVQITHQAVNGHSEIEHRGIATDKARQHFCAQTEVQTQALGCVALQHSRNYVLSAQAEVDVQPQLLIHTDEVQGKHGATVGQIDEAAMRYLQTRGLSEQQARQLLLQAFSRSLFDCARDILQQHIAIFNVPDGQSSSVQTSVHILQDCLQWLQVKQEQAILNL